MAQVGESVQYMFSQISLILFIPEAVIEGPSGHSLRNEEKIYNFTYLQAHSLI